MTRNLPYALLALTLCAATLVAQSDKPGALKSYENFLEARIAANARGYEATPEFKRSADTFRKRLRRTLQGEPKMTVEEARKNLAAEHAKALDFHKRSFQRRFPSIKAKAGMAGATPEQSVKMLESMALEIYRRDPDLYRQSWKFTYLWPICHPREALRVVRNDVLLTSRGQCETMLQRYELLMTKRIEASPRGYEGTEKFKAETTKQLRDVREAIAKLKDGKLSSPKSNDYQDFRGHVILGYFEHCDEFDAYYQKVLKKDPAFKDISKDDAIKTILQYSLTVRRVNPDLWRRIDKKSGCWPVCRTVQSK